MSKAAAQEIIQDNSKLKYSKVCAILEQRFKRLGKGYYGSVYDTEDGNVVKVYQRKDRAYQTFQALAARVNCKHFPAFSGSENHDNYNVVYMERLTTVTSTTKFYGRTVDEVINALQMYIGVNDEDIEIFGETYPELPVTLLDATNVVRLLTASYQTDLRIPNIAQRGETLVILDPLANSYQSLKKAS